MGELINVSKICDITISFITIIPDVRYDRYVYALSKVGGLAPGASKYSQLCINFPFISLNNLKLVECRISIFF